MRLDRAMGCPAWSDLYPNVTVQHVSSYRSDQCPILIELEKTQQTSKTRIPRYEAMREREPSLTECVDEAWKHYKPASNLGDIQQKLAHTMSSMDSWSSTNFGSINRDIKNLKNKLEQLKKQLQQKLEGNSVGVNKTG
jgi:DNA polymerase II small subunit/DNA polymerase delta subunit B